MRCARVEELITKKRVVKRKKDFIILFSIAGKEGIERTELTTIQALDGFQFQRIAGCNIVLRATWKKNSPRHSLKNLRENFAVNL